MMRWQQCAFSELSTAELYAVLTARSAVFVVEQRCAYLDLDGYDLEAQHVIAWDDAVVAGYLRIVDPGRKFPERSIGRLLTQAPYRRTGLGRALMARALQQLDARYPAEPIRIGAQARLEAFYGAFGFVSASDIYLEDGIPHVEMLRAAAKSPSVSAHI